MRTIIEMVNHTRLDCVLGGATGMRAGVAQAIHHAAHRSAFGKRAGRAAADAQRARRPRGRVRGGDDLGAAPGPRLRRGDRRRRARRQTFKRIANAVLKYWICKRAPSHAGRGARVPRRQRLRRGVGDAAALPRGAAATRSGRARATSSASTCCGRWSRAPASLEAFFAEVDEGAGAEPRLDAYAAALRDGPPATSTTIEARARRAGRADGAGAAGLAAGPLRRRGRRRRLLRLPPRRRLGPGLRHPARRHRLRRIIDRHRPVA